MDILEEALKVVKAAREFKEAVDGRIVRIRQDQLYAAVKAFDILSPPYDQKETKQLSKSDYGEICKHCKVPMERRRHPDGWKPSSGQKVYYVAWDYCHKCKRIYHYDKFKVYCSPKKVFTKARKLSLYTGKDNKPPWED